MRIGQVFTKKYVSNFMFSLFNIDKNGLLLDPCFGEGVFIEEAIERGYANITGYEIDKDLFYNLKAKELSKNINLHLSDFLLNDSTVKYNGIIMNPPYIRHEKIDKIPYVDIDKQTLKKEKIYADIPGNSNYYVYFLSKALSMLADEGELIIIFPGNWQTSTNSDFIFNLINKKFIITDIIEVSGDAFDEEAQVDVVIMKIVRSKTITKDAKIRRIIIDDKKVIEDVTNNVIEKKVEFVREVDFDTYATVRRGITTGYNKMFINPEYKETLIIESTEKIISSPKDIVGYSTNKASYDRILLIKDNKYTNDEISAYINHYKTKILISKSPKTLFNKIKNNEENWHIIGHKRGNIPNIIFSYFVRNDMKFILNENFEYIRDNFYIIEDKIGVYLLMSLLNNYYTYYQLETFGKKQGKGLLKLQTYDMRRIIFPSIDLISDKDILSLELYGKKLGKNNDIKYVEKITEILSKYSTHDFVSIKNIYFNVKNQRLGF